MANFAQTQTIVGLNTTTIFVAPTAGIYFINGQLTLPSISAGNGASSVVSLVKKNGSTQYTGAAGATGFQVKLTLAAADIITTALSSSASGDQGINAVKGVVSAGQYL